MKASKIALWALIALAASELPAQAAWNNVFQPTFFGRSRQSTSNYCQSCVPVIARSAPVMVMAPACNTCQSPPPVVAFSAPAPVCAPACPPPVQQCTTNYVQRSFYQPVTTYESRSFYEPVTTFQTSFFYEAVTTMQTSFHPDPCNCGCTVAKSCPVTTYQLRSQTSPVQSWVQRCAQVPVTSYKQSFYLEPQTTCCNTNVGGPVAVAAACPTGNCQQQPPAAPQSPTPSYSPPPVIDQPRPAPSGPSVGTTSNSGYQPQRTASAWQPVVTLAAITPEKNDTVQGQVVRTDRTPTANTQVLFVNASTGERRSITTNDAGRFNLGLANGSYHVYLAGSNGSAAYHSLVNVTPNQPINLINN